MATLAWFDVDLGGLDNLADLGLRLGFAGLSLGLLLHQPALANIYDWICVSRGVAQ
jgi:hypothetical protein